MNHFHGKKDARDPLPGVPLMSELLRSLPPGTLPTIPRNFGHGYDFGASSWLMLGNGPDNSVFNGFGGCGDCVFAGGAHETMEAAYQGRRPIPRFTGASVVAQYATYASYDPHTGQNDTGADPQEVYRLRQTKGLYDDDKNVHVIGQYVALTPGDINHLWAAVYLFECAGIGVQLTEANEQSFPGVWDYAKGSPQTGGHYIPVMGNNGLISWGCRVGFTVGFYENQCDEAYCYIDPLRYNAVTGATTEHFADADLEKFITLVAQAKSGRVSN